MLSELSWESILLGIAAVFTAIGSLLAPSIGYFRKIRAGETQPMPSATVIDSSVGREIVIELRRIADAADKIVIEMGHTAENERMRDAVAAALQAERRKKERGD